MSLDAALAHFRSIAQSVEVPVNGDMEGSTGDASNTLFELKLAVERIRAARRAIDDSCGAGELHRARSGGVVCRD